MSDTIPDTISYAIGAEVEHTPAFSKKTLFVEGFAPANDVARIAMAEKVHHVRFSAKTPARDWDQLITDILDLGFWVTLEFHTAFHLTFQNDLNKGIWQSRRFVPLVKVSLHNLATSGTNLTIKFESETNDGVWTWNQHELMDNNKFTLWQDYDERIEYLDCPPKTKVQPTVDEVVEDIVKLEPTVAEVEPEDFLHVKAADIPPDVTNTTTGSIDSADANKEPELVARKTVNEAKAKQTSKKAK